MDPLSPLQLEAGALTRPVEAPRAGVSPEAAAQAAEDFEAVFLAQMLQAMGGEALSGGGAFWGGFGEQAASGQLLEEYGKILAKAGGVGLADALTREILQLQGVQVQP